MPSLRPALMVALLCACSPRSDATSRAEVRRSAPAADSADRVRILEPMGEIARAFAAGDFTVPGFVHARDVPGTAVMSARRARISYGRADRA